MIENTFFIVVAETCKAEMKANISDNETRKMVIQVQTSALNCIKTTVTKSTACPE